MKTVLLTGATGFIGCHCIAPLLKYGYEVHGVTSKLRGTESTNVIWHEADLLKLETIAPLLEKVRPTHLLHMAWYVVPGKSITSEVSFQWVQASIQIMKAFHAVGGRRLVIAGSSLEYDWSYGYCNELFTPKEANTVYGHCKNALRLLMESYAQTHNLSSAWPRVFFLYGPNEHPDRLVPSVIRALLLGKEARCSDGNQIRDYLFVQDVADAIGSLLNSDVEGTINIGSGQPIALKNIVITLGRMLDRPDLIKLGAIARRSNDAQLVIADVSHLSAALTWRPQYSLEEGLKQTIAWWHDRYESKL